MNGCADGAGLRSATAKETLNRWIAHELARAAREITEAIEAYRFNEAAGAVYRFVWNVYCDWYLELAKPVLLGPESAARAETRATVAWVRDEILKLLHPFMPFITEELWAVTAEGATAARPAARPHAMAGAGRTGGCGGRGGDRLGDRSRHRDPLGARRDERPAGDADAARAGRRRARDPRAGGPLGRVHQPAGAPRPASRFADAPPPARCSSWCAARWRRCRSRA